MRKPNLVVVFEKRTGKRRRRRILNRLRLRPLRRDGHTYDCWIRRPGTLARKTAALGNTTGVMCAIAWFGPTKDNPFSRYGVP